MNKKLIYKFSIFFVFAFFLASCEDNILEDLFAGLNNIGDYDMCKMKTVGYKNYEIKIDGRWTESRFGGYTPAKYIDGAHFSRFVVFTHKSDTNIFKEGNKASSDLEKLAENGKTDITSLHDDKSDIGCVVVGEGMKGGESQTIVVPVNNKYNSITVISMIAPSSDWFVAKKIKLGKDNNLLDGVPFFILDSSFKSSGKEDMKNYDAGTEQDTLAFDFDNDPEPNNFDISRLGSPFSSSDVLVRIEYSQINR